jgi:hypothetical protein
MAIKDRVWIYGLLDEDKNRSKPTAWLNDLQVANLQAIHWKSLKKGVWKKSEGKLSVFFYLPLDPRASSGEYRDPSFLSPSC